MHLKIIAWIIFLNHQLILFNHHKIQLNLKIKVKLKKVIKIVMNIKI